MNFQGKSYLFLLLISYSLCANVENDISIINADRLIDITSQVVKITSKITLQNNGKSSADYFVFAVEPEAKDNVSDISSSTEDEKTNLETTEEDQKGAWKIKLRRSLKPGEKLKIEVKVFLTNFLTPLPLKIKQDQNQLVVYKGNLYLYSPYTVAKQTTTVLAYTEHFESFTEVKPYKKVSGNLFYGPYKNVEPFTTEELGIHYENNAPFLVVTNLQRVLYISHGKIAVEETISLEHKGATLKGGFSRPDFQHYQYNSKSANASVDFFTTLLPASARDIYYRDDIGIIYTSEQRVWNGSIELYLRPRFPLLGGWKTVYTIGYNIPSFEYMYPSGGNVTLKIRLLDHIFDGMVVEEMTSKIVLPETAENVEVKLPYPVERLPVEYFPMPLRVFSKGRHAVVLRKKNLVEHHIQDVEITFNFSRIIDHAKLIDFFCCMLILCIVWFAYYMLCEW